MGDESTAYSQLTAVEEVPYVTFAGNLYEMSSISWSFDNRSEAENPNNVFWFRDKMTRVSFNTCASHKAYKLLNSQIEGNFIQIKILALFEVRKTHNPSYRYVSVSSFVCLFVSPTKPQSIQLTVINDLFLKEQCHWDYADRCWYVPSFADVITRCPLSMKILAPKIGLPQRDPPHPE
jgi:hypothetical protein